jgi:hypothetical protein
MAFLNGAGTSPGVAGYGLTLWRLEAMGNGDDSELRRRNHNLDSDRGFQHDCWRLKAGSISADPLAVEILTYTDVV